MEAASLSTKNLGHEFQGAEKLQNGLERFQFTDQEKNTAVSTKAFYRSLWMQRVQVYW